MIEIYYYLSIPTTLSTYDYVTKSKVCIVVDIYIYIVISVGNNLSVSRRLAETVWQFISKILIQISSICKDNVTHIYLQSTTPTYNQHSPYTLHIHVRAYT